MADPVTLSTIGIGSTVAGGGIGALGSLLGGESQASMFNYQAGVAKMNKAIDLQNADYARRAGEVEAQTSGMKTRATEGAIVAGQAASGLDVNKGSAQLVQESQHEIGLYDQAIIRSNAAKKAYGFEVEAAGEEAKATMYGMAASKSKTAGYLGALASILGTAGSVAGKWLDAKRTGIGSSAPINSSYYEPGGYGFVG